MCLDQYNEGFSPSGWCGGEDGCTGYGDFLIDEFNTLCVELCDPMGSDYVSPSVNITTDAHGQSEV